MLFIVDVNDLLFQSISLITCNVLPFPHNIIKVEQYISLTTTCQSVARGTVQLNPCVSRAGF